MPLIVTPSKLARQSEFYHQLGSMLSAGLGLIPALDHLGHHPPARSFRLPIRRLLEHLGQGANFTESIQQIPGWLPSFDLALIEAGEKSGRLDACCRLLADYYRQRADMARRVLSGLAYPLFVLHMGVLLFPFADFFTSGNLVVYLSRTLGVLVPLYAAAFLIALACQGRRGEEWRAWIERILHPIPLLGTARRYLALARLAAALEALLNAGVSIIQGWGMAAAASGSPAILRAVRGWLPLLENGSTPSELVRASPVFPEMFASLYFTGEVSGSLDDTLKRLHVLYQEDGTRKLQAVVEWTPRLVYLCVALIIAYRIVSFYLGYFGEINKLTGP